MKKDETTLYKQVKEHSNKEISKPGDYEDIEETISTGSTLLDLAISGGRVREGGIPLGVLVEVFGPSSCGKTVLLCQIAGNMQRKNGSIMFYDPEARLNSQFAKMFGVEINKIAYDTPDTVTQVFSEARKWKPESSPCGIFADSLAALSTDLEMGKDEGDKLGMRRAKEFSEQLRRTCRIITKKKYIMVCSNQVRQNLEAGPYGQKYTSPGGEAIGFYSSLRLRAKSPQKIKKKVTVAGKEITQVVGVRTQFEVFKSTVWKPYRVAPVTIIFDYGVDDIRENLQFIKDYTKSTVYTLHGEKLAVSIDKSIEIIEKEGKEKELKDEVIDLWNEIENKFSSNRRRRF